MIRAITRRAAVSWPADIGYQQLLDAIAVYRVADRPDRYEPRLRKQGPKHYGFLREPRRDTKREMAKVFHEN